MAVVRGLPRFDGRSSFATWAYRVATNACLDEMRRRRRRPEPTDDAVLAERRSAAADLDSAVAGRVDVDRALMALPLDFRAAVVLRDLCGIDYAETAEVLDTPAGTVKSRIARGRAMLSDSMQPGNPGTRPDRQSRDHA